MIRPGDRSVRDVYVAGQPARRVYAGTGAGSQVVWESGRLPVVRIGNTFTNDARDGFRAACLDYGIDYTTVQELPFQIEFARGRRLNALFDGCAGLVTPPTFYGQESLTATENMFRGCLSLEAVPAFDTSSVTNMSGMFQNCSSLVTVPAFDTSSVTNMTLMFQNCSSLTTVPDLIAANVTNAAQMFHNCTALTDGNVRLIGKHPSVSTGWMIQSSGLTREPFYDAAGNPI